MERVFTYEIKEDSQGQTIEQYLKMRAYPQKLLASLRRTEEGITIAQKKVYTTHVLQAGEILVIQMPEEKSSEHIVPVPMNVMILYEDEDLMVVNKASGVPIHPSQGNYENTLANGLAFYFQQQGKRFIYRAINRLDRDTTGLLIVSKNRLSGAILSQMVAQGQIHRTYLAIVNGHLEGEGIVEAPIMRAEDSTIKRCIDFAKGERAVTHYRALEQRGDYTLVQLKLDTGRTHQIRVHMTYMGHPLPGDFLYNPSDHAMCRQALHSWKLSFCHPITGVQMEFMAPLPDDMKMLWGNEVT